MGGGGGGSTNLFCSISFFVLQLVHDIFLELLDLHDIFFCVKLQSRFCVKIKNCADFEFYSVYTFAKHKTCSMEYYKSEYTISTHLTMLPLITNLRSLKMNPSKL